MRRNFVLALFLASSAVTAQASSITSAAASTAQCNLTFRYSPPPGGIVTFPGGIQNISASGVNSAASNCGSATFAIPPQPLLTPIDWVVNAGSTGNASGTASYGSLTGSTSATSGGGGILHATGQYNGSFDDSMTFTGGGGTATFIWVRTGRKFIPFAGSLANDNISATVDGVVHTFAALPNLFTSQSEVYSYSRAFTDGDTVNFFGLLALNTADLGEAATNQARLDLFIQVQLSGGPVTVTTASGTAYAASPEPAAIALAASGLAILAWVRRRRS